MQFPTLYILYIYKREKTRGTMLNFSDYTLNKKENIFADKSRDAKAAEQEAQVVTVPIVNSQPVKEQAKLDAAGNVRLVENVQTDEKMGLAIEKTAQQTKVKTAEKENNKKTKGESLDQYFSRYYTQYSKADEAGKQKFIERYIKSFTDKDKQAKEFERLRKAGVSAKEIERLAGAIDAMDAKNQFKAAKTICTEGSDEQKKAGRKGVAKNIQTFDKTVQKDATAMLIDTKDIDAIKEASTHTAQCDKTVQTDIVKMYQVLENAEVNKNLIDQYADYAKENQVDIHKIMSSSKLSETVEYAAANIYNFAAENQKAAIQITISTDNEAAINAAAAKANYYDKTVQSDIKTMLSSTRYESVKETLANAPQPSAAEKTSEQSVASQAQVTKETFKEANLTEKLKMISSMKGSDKEVFMKEMFKTASTAEKLALISSLSPSALFSALNSILDSNPSMEILSKITSIMGQVQEKDQSVLMQKLDKSYSSSVLSSQVSLFDATMQKAFIKRMADQGDLGKVNKESLSTDSRSLYNELLKKQA